MERAERRDLALVASFSLVAFVLGIISLGRGAFFPDEAYTWSTVDRGFGGMVSILWHSEAFQVLHSLLLWPIAQLSDSSFALRLPSVVFFAATVPAVWALTRRLFDNRAALIAAALLALNAVALQYAQEARSYTLAMMFAAYAAAALARDVFAPTRWSRAAWMACSIAAVWAHGMAVFAVVAQLGSLLALPSDRLRGRRFLHSAIVVGLLVVPVIIAPELQINRTEAFPASARPGLVAIRLFIWAIAGRSVFSVVVYGIAGLAAVVAGIHVARRTGRSLDTWRFALPLAWFVFPPAFLIVYSLVDPIWVDRYAIPSLGALVVLVAYGLSRVRPTRALVAVLLIAFASATYGIVRWYQFTGLSAFDKLLATVHMQVQPGDGVVLATDRSRVPLEFALRHSDLRADLQPVFPASPWGTFVTGDQHGTVVPASTLRDTPLRRVWVVTAFYETTPEKATAEQRLRDAGYHEVFSRSYAGPITVSLYERS